MASTIATSAAPAGPASKRQPIRIVLDPVLCQKWIGGNERDIERFPSVSMGWQCVETAGFGTPTTAPKTDLPLPLPLQFLAAWLAVWLGRVLQV